ncbi:MAG: hypothetical protein A2057_11510 [Ignavibacteria bacterium GWA2_35_9]|nr:MAG: Glycosyl transferase family 2 [Microgenomates group bacterium GW2011_GWC1_39_12]KKR79980.1 MAG: Glycosyl transferase family 2 [Microgenomates group bacterium GW2011_GWB1_40_9]OGU32825.1 MAG: hypothetical protein A2057_11510 [Ignavibacteria bacterium GWA2_35_9]
MISVLIPTTNRPHAVLSCLRSLQKNTLSKFEVLVVDQSNDDKTKLVVTSLCDARFRYIHSKQQNKSIALNCGVRQARGTILCFTDDDCIVTKNWLSIVQKDFFTHPHVDAVFGTTRPYAPKKHAGLLCPSVFQQNKHRIISSPCKHFVSVGFGNNMAIRKKALKTDPFKPWLGPHSIGGAAEDAEIILQLLIHKKNILCDPTCIVYHNKWLDLIEIKKQNTTYARGEMACYGYFYFQKQLFAKQVIKDSIRASILTITKGERNILTVAYSCYELLIKTFGLTIGFYYAHADPIAF